MTRSGEKGAPPKGIPPGHGGSIFEPMTNDVLSGRGGRINSHEGNIRFREIVNQYKARYLSKTTKKLDKAHIAAEIVTLIRSKDPPGRFLKEDGKDDKTGAGQWIEIGDERARKKAGQALREDAPEIRPQIDDESNNSSQQQPTTNNTNALSPMYPPGGLPPGGLPEFYPSDGGAPPYHRRVCSGGGPTPYMGPPSVHNSPQNYPQPYFPVQLPPERYPSSFPGSNSAPPTPPSPYGHHHAPQSISSPHLTNRAPMPGYITQPPYNGAMATSPPPPPPGDSYAPGTPTTPAFNNTSSAAIDGGGKKQLKLFQGKYIQKAVQKTRKVANEVRRSSKKSDQNMMAVQQEAPEQPQPPQLDEFDADYTEALRKGNMKNGKEGSYDSIVDDEISAMTSPKIFAQHQSSSLSTKDVTFSEDVFPHPTANLTRNESGKSGMSGTSHTLSNISSLRSALSSDPSIGNHKNDWMRKFEMVSTSSLKSQNSLAVSSLLGRADTSEDANNKSTNRRESWQQRTMSGLSADGDNELDTSYLNSMLKSDRSSSELMVEKHGALLEDDMEQHKLLPPKRSAMKREHSSSKRNSLTTDEMFVMEQAKISTMRQMSSNSLDRRGSMNSTSSGDNLLAPFNERQHSLRAYSSFDDLMSLGANDDVSMSLIRDELVDGGAEGVNMANMAFLRQSGITSSMRSFGTMGSFGNFSNHNQRGRLSSFVSRDSAMQMSMNSIDSVGTGFSGSSGSSREDWMNTFKDMQHINSEGVPWKQETMRDYRQESQRSIFSDISTNMDALDLAAPANFPKMLNISPPTQSITTTRVGVTAMNENYDESQLK